MGRLAKFLAIAIVLNELTSGYKLMHDSNMSSEYSINYVSQNVFQNTILNNASLMADGEILNFGDETSCFKPNVRSETVDSDFWELKLQEKRVLNKSSEVITKKLSGKCLIYPNGFWNYSFCYGKSVAQFTMPSDMQGLHYLLGKFDIPDHDDLRLVHDLGGYYVADTGSYGDVCVETDAMREVEIQYVCKPGVNEARILAVREVKLCRYAITVAIPELCYLDLFSTEGKNKSVHSIVCTRDVRSTDFDSVYMINYQPFFLGHGFYYLQNHSDRNDSDSDISSASMLLYTSDLVFSEENADLHKSEQLFLERAVAAFQELTSQRLLFAPDGQIFSTGDTVSWVTEVVNSGGEKLCVLRVTIDEASTANLSFDQILPGSIPIRENIVHYTRAIPQEVELFSELSTEPDLVDESPKRDRTFEVSSGIIVSERRTEHTYDKLKQESTEQENKNNLSPGFDAQEEVEEGTEVEHDEL